MFLKSFYMTKNKKQKKQQTKNKTKKNKQTNNKNKNNKVRCFNKRFREGRIMGKVSCCTLKLLAFHRSGWKSYPTL
jgi:hypothetical protein